MRRSLLVLAAVGLLAACGSDGSAETTAAAAPTTMAPTTMAPTTMAPTTMAPTTTAASTATITMSGMAFSGAQTVQVGQEIELVNSDDVPHTWTAEDGPFDVSIAPGQTATYTFDEPGEYSYFCEIHPSMTGTIRVEG
ncbi:MAG TPA: cupredoxin domain-containing protein [Acidimicrobiia bacterium]|nr:cupredoxin domain-containing protein [Acidimicrobiia bacterium]